LMNGQSDMSCLASCMTQWMRDRWMGGDGRSTACEFQYRDGRCTAVACTSWSSCSALTCWNAGSFDLIGMLAGMHLPCLRHKKIRSKGGFFYVPKRCDQNCSQLSSSLLATAAGEPFATRRALAGAATVCAAGGKVL